MTDETADETPTQSVLPYDQPRWVVTPAADVGALALRLLGVKLLVDFLATLSGVPLVLMGQDASAPFSPWLSIGFYLVWYGTLAAILMVAARPIAEAIFGRRTVAAHDLGVGAWMMLIVSGVGLAFALFSLQDAAGAVVVMVTRFQANVGVPAPRAVEAAELARLLAPIAKAGVGVLLFFRPSLLVTPWLRGANR